MNKRIVLWSVAITMMVSLTGISASAVDTSEVSAFLYDGHSYVPLKSTAAFLGAPVRWDAEKGRAVVTYMGEELSLKPNSVQALHAGQPVVISSPPVVMNGVTYVPVETFKKFYNVPVEWDKANSQMRMKGPDGWTTVKASSSAPWHGGPPPWAPAWGQRGQGTPDQLNKARPGASGKTKSNNKKR